MMPSEAVIQFLVLFVTFVGCAGLIGMVGIVWPLRRLPGGWALLTLTGGFAVTFAWVLSLDFLSMLYGRGVLPLSTTRALIARSIITATVWITLWLMRRPVR